ncbi:MAG: hypothetical protein HZB39_14270 [Planctomycetes bacterium]|nr:hypothetical protein [Planctomycetota bacterium]
MTKEPGDRMPWGEHADRYALFWVALTGIAWLVGVLVFGVIERWRLDVLCPVPLAPMGGVVAAVWLSLEEHREAARLPRPRPSHRVTPPASARVVQLVDLECGFSFMDRP